MDIIKKSGGKLITNIEVFDVYEGDKISSDEKSIAYKLKFEDTSKTLTEEEKVVFDIFLAHLESFLKYYHDKF